MFLQGDSIMVVEPEKHRRVRTVGMHNFRMLTILNSELLHSSCSPIKILLSPGTSRSRQGKSSVVTKQIESILAGVPVHLKFTSDRINNFRVTVRDSN